MKLGETAIDCKRFVGLRIETVILKIWKDRERERTGEYTHTRLFIYIHIYIYYYHQQTQVHIWFLCSDSQIEITWEQYVVKVPKHVRGIQHRKSLSGKFPQVSFSPPAQINVCGGTLDFESGMSCHGHPCMYSCLQDPLPVSSKQTCCLQAGEVKSCPDRFFGCMYIASNSFSHALEIWSCRVSSRQALSTTRKRKALNIDIWYVRQKLSKTAVSG